jgi:hypothetical protein
VNENPIQRLWRRASACLVVSAAAFVFGGALVFGAIHESYSHGPRGWLADGLTVLGVGVFALGATTWVRAFGLVAQQMRDRRGAA